MRYVAVLQRHDSGYTDVAIGNDRAEVVAAAQAVYTALIPTILARGIEAVKKDIADCVSAGDAQGANELRSNLTWDSGIAMHLAAREWGVAVYDRASKDPDEMWTSSPDLIFWVGASREEPLVDQ